MGVRFYIHCGVLSSLLFFKIFLQLGKKKREKPKLLAHRGNPWGLCSHIAFGTAECQGSWLTTNKAEPSPLGKPADLSAGCLVPTDVNASLYLNPIPRFWKTERELNSKQEKKKKSPSILWDTRLFF